MSEKQTITTASNDNNNVFDTARLIGTLIDNSWLIIGVTSLFALVAILYSIFAQPMYQADSLVQVEKNTSTSLITNIAEMLPNNQPESTTEIELIQSRMILGKTIKDLGLETTISEKYFPVIGKGLARILNKEPANLVLSNFDVDPSLYGQPFILKVKDSENFTLESPNGTIVNGKLGQKNQNSEYNILVTGIKADSGTEFEIVRNSELSQYNNLLNSLTVQDKGKDTGVLTLSLIGDNKDQVQRVLNSITTNYLMQNIERKSEEAAKSLSFLKQQLPIVRSNLDEAENKLNLFRQQNDSVDVPLEAKSILDTIAATDAQLNELTFKEAEISQLYTKEHPAYKALLEKRQTLEDEKEKLNQRVNHMPKTQQEIIKLTRDVESGQAIYMQLLNKQSELSINKASTVGNVRIVDPAMTDPSPVKPKKTLIILITTLLGAILSITFVLIKSILHRGIESPDALEERGISVYASIPLSEWQKSKDNDLFLSRHRVKSNTRTVELLAVGNPTDLAMEAIRSLRTSIHFALVEAKNNVILISGASPASGKTFVCMNLAAVIAQSQKKILFIDADMRKGYSHELLSIKNDKGLSEILSGQSDYVTAIKETTIEGLNFISRGSIPPNPSELLMRKNFKDLLDWASANYEIVLIDTPPILAVTDASIISRYVGTSLLVARFGVNTIKEMEVCIRRFETTGTQIKGVILNAIEKKASSYYGEYGYYHYTYDSKKE
ncbi:tyrosine-protein kinase Wzc [Sodalis sp. RH15]|uniref:tyrosine-protein kinase Wzc n=1 Tax=Sodalis sp. RH15 TaxID=3394330 RepID=UPI0039B665C8